MAGINTSILRDLSHPDTRVFESCAKRLRDSLAASEGSGRDALLSAIQQLAKDTPLGLRERDRRLHALLDLAASHQPVLAEVARMARADDFAAKNVIMSRLPPNLRQSVYSPVLRHAAEAVADPPVQSIPSAAPTHASSSGEAKSKSADAKAVLLLGSEDEHAANIALLKSKDFTPIRRETIDVLNELVNTGICGIVVGGSCWKQLDPKEHEEALKRVCSLSSFVWVRIDVDSLDPAVAAALPQIQQSIHLSQPSSATFCSGAGCKLTVADLANLSRIAELFASSQSTRFHPAEITPEESFLSRAAATKHVRDHHLDGDIRLEVMRTHFFNNGRSAAKIMSVKPDDGGAPFVIKLDSISAVQAEMKRFRQYIDRSDGRMQPEMHFHGDHAAIVFRLIDAAGKPGVPAPMLDERLEKLMNAEIGSWGEPPPKEEDLTLALQRVADKLAALNAKAVTGRDDNYGWIADAVCNLAERGVVWQIHRDDGTSIDIAHLIRSAAARVRKLDGRATVHGDVHLQNILVSDDRDPYLIDYACSGPGHPCYDLVRLYAAVTYRTVRAISDEKRMASLFRAVHVVGRDYEEIEVSFDDLLKPVGNRISTRLGLRVRQLCLNLLAKHGGTLDDYLAMQSLVACHALTMILPQSGIVRAMIRAVADGGVVGAITTGRRK